MAPILARLPDPAHPRAAMPAQATGIPPAARQAQSTSVA